MVSIPQLVLVEPEERALLPSRNWSSVAGTINLECCIALHKGSHEPHLLCSKAVIAPRTSELPA